MKLVHWPKEKYEKFWRKKKPFNNSIKLFMQEFLYLWFSILEIVENSLSESKSHIR